MSIETTANNSRIAKNTLMLFVRMLLLMVVSLFTSRVILDSLGEEDFGTYNVVGGVVAMLSIFSGPLRGAIQRFLTYELGTGNIDKLKRVFSTSVNIQLLLSLVVFVICEIVGVWFLHTQMNIPEGRMPAADWVLQCSILTFVINLSNIPFMASIVSHENMGVFAYISILEVSLKLLVAYLIYISPFDKLKLYAVLLLTISLLVLLIYVVYCKRHFEEINYSRHLDKDIFREMATFAGWNFTGSTVYMLNTQGVNMLINVFFGVKINAARAIAVQVDAAAQQFATNFTTAINPQITKTYASKDYENMNKLVSRGSKYSFFIMLLVVVPILLEADAILSIWLKQVPNESALFLRLVVLYSLIAIMQNSMYMAVMATGKLKRYQIKMNIIGALTFPLTWVAYYLGQPAYVTYVIALGVISSLIFVRLDELRRLVDFPVKDYCKFYLSRILVVGVVSFVVPFLFQQLFEPSFVRLLVVCLFSVLWSLLSIWVLGLSKEERTFFVSKVSLLFHKFFFPLFVHR